MACTFSARFAECPTIAVILLVIKLNTYSCTTPHLVANFMENYLFDPMKRLHNFKHYKSV